MERLWGSRIAERVGIEIAGTRLMNIYHHRERILDVPCISDELEGGNGKTWVCAADFNCDHRMWVGNAREPAGSWREVTELIELGQLMIEPGTPTWRGGKNHRSSTIDLVIASNAAPGSMAEIATDLYTGSDHKTLSWEIGNCSAEENRRIQHHGGKFGSQLKITISMKKRSGVTNGAGEHNTQRTRYVNLPWTRSHCLNHFSTIFLGENDGRQEQNASGQQSLRRKVTFLFIFIFISFNVIQPVWLYRQIQTHKIADMSERRKQANKQKKTKQHT
jgi:hypothetical protein